MRKPDFCLCVNKGADQLRSNCEANQRICLRYTDSTVPLLSKSGISFCACTTRFVPDLVGTQTVGFLTHRLIYSMVDAPLRLGGLSVWNRFVIYTGMEIEPIN